MLRPSYLLLLILALASAPAAEPNPAEARLRDSLRNTMLQLRAAQAERDTLQAEKTQLEQEKQTAATQLESLSKQAALEKETSSRKIESLETKTASQDAEIDRLSVSLDKWKAAHQQIESVAQAKELERAKAALHAIELQRRVDDQQAKNFAMYKIGTEILDRYENFGLGTALAAREPFVGTTRVRLQNLVQEYQDKLLEQRLKAEAAPAPVPAAEKKSTSGGSRARGEPSAPSKTAPKTS